MTVPHLKLVRASPDADEAADPAAVHAVAAWANLLARTLKTCRLYDGANPTVVRFREDLANELVALQARHGSIPLKVTSTALVYGGQEVHSAQSRDDHLAGVLHRDGIRQITLEAGIAARELDALVDQILKVTGPSAGDDDLVTLLWDADLPHVLLVTVPLEGEADGGGESEAERPAALAFPRQERGAVAPPPEDGEQASDIMRSEDWSTGESSVPIEQAYGALQPTLEAETTRFRQECDTTLGQEPVTGVLRVLEDCFGEDLSEADRGQLGEFMPRVLREALSLGHWRAASATLGLLRQCDPKWSVEAFGHGLCGPFAITTRRVVESLDRQDAEDVQAFLELAREFGHPLVEWLMHVLAESDQMRVRRPLARTIAELLAGRPELLSRWIRDERWYVVRNVVHILGWIGGEGILGELMSAAKHPELRVRREVVAALGGVDPDRARPILVNMMEAAEPKLFGTILHQLGSDPHPSVTEVLLGCFQDEGLAARSEDERRALFIALATRGDAVVPALEAALNEGGLFSRRPEPDRTAIALCLARIGTPDAQAILERGLRSRRGSVRRACLIAGAHGETGHD